MIAESLVDSSLLTKALEDIALLQREITLDGENKERINSLKDLSMKLSKLEKTVKRHDSEIGSLSERMERKDEEVGSLNERVDVEVGSLNERMGKKDVEVGSLKRRMDTVKVSLPSKQLCVGKQKLYLF